MSKTRSANLANARRWSDDLRRKAIDAVEAGQDVIASGMRKRAPAKIKASIRARKVGSARDFVGGFVVAEHSGAGKAERKTPFVAPTDKQDGHKAIRAMLKALQGS